MEIKASKETIKELKALKKIKFPTTQQQCQIEILESNGLADLERIIDKYKLSEK